MPTPELWRKIRTFFITMAQMHNHKLMERMVERRRAAEEAVARGDVMTEAIPPGVVVPETKQGDLSMYSESALAKRKTLAKSKRINAVIKTHWSCLTGKKKLGRKVVTKEQYIRFFSLCHNLLNPGSEQSAEDVRQALSEEWLSDSGGEDYMTFIMFHTAVFEMLDQWVPSTMVKDYVDLGKMVYSHVVAASKKGMWDTHDDPEFEDELPEGIVEPVDVEPEEGEEEEEEEEEEEDEEEEEVVEVEVEVDAKPRSQPPAAVEEPPPKKLFTPPPSSPPPRPPSRPPTIPKALLNHDNHKPYGYCQGCQELARLRKERQRWLAEHPEPEGWQRIHERPWINAWSGDATGDDFEYIPNSYDDAGGQQGGEGGAFKGGVAGSWKEELPPVSDKPAKVVIVPRVKREHKIAPGLGPNPSVPAPNKDMSAWSHADSSAPVASREPTVFVYEHATARAVVPAAPLSVVQLGSPSMGANAPPKRRPIAMAPGSDTHSLRGRGGGRGGHRGSLRSTAAPPGLGSIDAGASVVSINTQVSTASSIGSVGFGHDMRAVGSDSVPWSPLGAPTIAMRGQRPPVGAPLPAPSTRQGPSTPTDLTLHVSSMEHRRSPSLERSHDFLHRLPSLPSTSAPSSPAPSPDRLARRRSSMDDSSPSPVAGAPTGQRLVTVAFNAGLPGGEAAAHNQFAPPAVLTSPMQLHKARAATPDVPKLSKVDLLDSMSPPASNRMLLSPGNAMVMKTRGTRRGGRLRMSPVKASSRHLRPTDSLAAGGGSPGARRKHDRPPRAQVRVPGPSLLL